MAIDKLSLYNNALLLIGQRTLTNLTEDREPRYLLDGVYDLGAIEYCLEIVKPVFSRKTVALTSSTANPEHDLGNDFTLPTDYVTTVQVYSDSKLDQPISRYIIEGNILTCDFSTIYLRYSSDDYVTSFTNWSNVFAQVVSAYLGREISVKLDPTQYGSINSLFTDRIEIALKLDERIEPIERSSVTTNTLTNDWRIIYNDALLIMGLEEITQNTDDSNRRTKLDRALDANLVKDLLEDTGWTFAVTSTRSTYNVAVEPAWGYTRAHDKPADMYRIVGLFYDEYMQQPLKLYQDEGDFFFTDEDEIIVSYISSDWLTTPAAWPAFFKRLVAAKMANDAAASLIREGADTERAKDTYEERMNSAMANDAMAAPPRKLAGGRWVSSRFKGGYRGRP
jgi:hypothetical protein